MPLFLSRLHFLPPFYLNPLPDLTENNEVMFPVVVGVPQGYCIKGIQVTWSESATVQCSEVFSRFLLG
jgi:hypothetical protein